MQTVYARGGGGAGGGSRQRQVADGADVVFTDTALAALRLYGYFCDFCFVFVLENKYDDDDAKKCIQRFLYAV